MSNSSDDIIITLWANLFPIPLSSEAESRIKNLISIGGKRDQQFFQSVLDVLIEDQSKQGLRLHKGFPLWWLSHEAGKSNPDKALEFMLESYVEDVLTRGNDSLAGFAATSLKIDFGLSTERIVALKESVVEKARSIFYPSDFVKDFVKGKGELKSKIQFEGVTEESQLGSIVAQSKEKLEADLRRSINELPANEVGVQNVVSAILLQIDPSTQREKTVGKLAEKEARVDFSMFGGKIGVEVKLIKERSNKASVVDQINADIAHYTGQLKRIVFVVYDACGAIDDVVRFGNDIKKGRPEIEVLVTKH